MRKPLFNKIREFAREIFLRFNEDRCLQLASSLTFTTLLALVPLLTVMLTVASAFPAFSGLTGQINDFIASHVLPEQISKTVLRYVDQFSERAGRLTLIGLSVLAAVSFLTMLTIERAFNIIWRHKRRRPMLQRIVVYWAILTLGPVLIGASLTMTSYLVTASMGLAKSVPLLGVLALWLAPLALTVGAFSLLYYVVPARAVQLRHALVGGIAAGILFELAKRGFAIYVSKVPTYTMVYGTFATFPIFLLWVYLSWVVTVLGAVVTASLPDFGTLRPLRVPLRGREFCDAVEVLLALAEKHARGQAWDATDLATRCRLPYDRCERLLDDLTMASWVGRIDNGRWALICPPESIKLCEIFRRFVLQAEQLAMDGYHYRLAELLERLGKGVDDILEYSIRDLVIGPKEVHQGGKVGIVY